MPSVAKGPHWFFRITLSHENAKMCWTAALSTIKLIDVERCLIVGHVGEKTEKEHVHGIITLNKSIQKQSFDVRLKSIFNVSGADYSSKPWDGGMEAGAGSYLYSDPNPVEVYCKGFSDPERDTFKEFNKQVQSVVQENKSRASGRCVERLLKQIADSNRGWKREEIIRQLLNDIREDRMYECGDFVLAKYVEEIYMKQLSKDMWEQYATMRTKALLQNWKGEEKFTELFSQE